MSSLGVALVTGAGRGIGRAIALRLAKDGFDIALNDINANKQHIESLRAEISRNGRRTSIVPANVKHEQEVKHMVDQTVQDLGSLDVMVANAGILRMKGVVDASLEDWEEVFAVNSGGVFLCYKYAAKQMIAQGRGGRIIAASSVAGKQGVPFLSAYSASKFAVRGLTHAVAQELAPYGITVNAYAPGPIATNMMDQIGDEAGNRQERYEAEISTVPLGRYGTPDEVAGLVSFLVSKDASYITGQSMSVNGGRFGD